MSDCRQTRVNLVVFSENQIKIRLFAKAFVSGQRGEYAGEAKNGENNESALH